MLPSLFSLLEKQYDIVSFHANGIGEKAAVERMDQDLFKVFIGFVPA
jgi:uncharacterized protein (UPF0261 family)